jgi:hypothetical protein
VKRAAAPKWVAMRGRRVAVSGGRLMEFLTILGQNVEVTVKPVSARKRGDISVVVQPP